MTVTQEFYTHAVTQESKASYLSPHNSMAAGLTLPCTTHSQKAKKKRNCCEIKCSEKEWLLLRFAEVFIVASLIAHIADTSVRVMLHQVVITYEPSESIQPV